MSENLIYYLLGFVTVPALIGLALMTDFIVYCIKGNPKFDDLDWEPFDEEANKNV